MSLQTQIDKARAEIRTDGYSLSIGEWLSLYEKDEIDVHPEFQRFFRWTPIQKSRLVESVLLGIPIPPIFVAQRADGIWDVVDGVQRLSTLYQLAGILKNENGQLLPPLTLEATKYLPGLAGKQWENADRPDHSLTSPQRLLIKRSKIDVSIILKESDEQAKYELFQRLNTGGSQLSDQEVRNSIMVMLNQEFYRWIKTLATDQNFRECVALSDRALEEQYDMELVVRFVVFRAMAAAELAKVGDMGDFLTDRTRELAQDKSFQYQQEEDAFRATFRCLNEAVAGDAFRRFDDARRRFVGGFSVSAYEVVALGLGYNIGNLKLRGDDIRARIQGMWSMSVFTDNSGSGVRASSRVPVIVPFGRKLFRK